MLEDTLRLGGEPDGRALGPVSALEPLAAPIADALAAALEPRCPPLDGPLDAPALASLVHALYALQHRYLGAFSRSARARSDSSASAAAEPPPAAEESDAVRGPVRIPASFLRWGPQVRPDDPLRWVIQSALLFLQRHRKPWQDLAQPEAADASLSVQLIASVRSDLESRRLLDPVRLAAPNLPPEQADCLRTLAERMGGTLGFSLVAAR